MEQTGAPRGRCFVVTPERFIQLFGMFNDGTADGGSARRFGWCNQEDPSSWAFSDVTSQAGYLDVEPGGLVPRTAAATIVGAFRAALTQWVRSACR